MKIKYLLILVTFIAFNSCYNSNNNNKQEESYYFNINNEIGYNWNNSMIEVHNKNFNNKTYSIFKEVDNNKASGLDYFIAGAADLVSSYLSGEATTETIENLDSQEWTNGPTIICGPVYYQHETFDIVSFRSKSCFCGEKPQMQYATLGYVEYSKKYEDEDDLETATEFYNSLLNHFNASNMKIIEKSENYCKYSDGETEIGVYLSFVEEGIIFKDKLPVINVDFVSNVQFPQTSNNYNNTVSTKSSKTTSSSNIGEYPFTATRELTKSELKNYSKSELKIMRNEIYARHGYIFKTDAMKSYFAQQSWYEPKYNNVDKYLNSIEIKNIATIKKVEDTK
ncbi:MAG: YARHG domain-containing protein [Bacteroidales bacterium]|nr:YARHG domain-containing protein [Bacteroidales bacterium]